MNDEIHDMSRVDAFMASRRRAMFLHSVWRPLLAGACGAAIIVATVWVAMPKFHYNDIEIPRVVVHDRDVTVDHVVPRDVSVDHVVPHDVTVDHIVPRNTQTPTPGPQASAPPKPTLGPDAPYAAKTPDENKFVDKPAYKEAQYRGRIVKSVDQIALSWEDGKNYWPAHWNAANSVVDYEQGIAFDSDQFVGDLGMCTEDEHKLSYCVALHNGVEVNILKKPAPAGAVSSMPKLTPAPAPAHAPTTSATDMVMVDVYVASYPVEAMVDTGCSFPMSVPKAYADALVRIGLAARSRSAQSILADGSTHPVDMIVIKSITVDGRTLSNVEASVSSSDTAPILLGLGALNRLGSYTITDGRLVFTGEQPA